MKTKESIKVGVLLVEAQIVSSAEMTEAIQVSKRLATPIGRVLVMSGCVREDELEASLIAQKLIRSGEIAQQAAVSALRRVHDRQISMSEALHSENIDARLDEDPETFGELLVDSNIVSNEQLEKAMAQSFAHGVPLGSALVLQGVLSPNVFPSLLQIQKEISRGLTSREEGVKAMQDTFLHWLKAEESLRRDKPIFNSDVISREHEFDQAWQAQTLQANSNLKFSSYTAAKAKTAPPGFAGADTGAADIALPYTSEIEQSAPASFNPLSNADQSSQTGALQESHIASAPSSPITASSDSQSPASPGSLSDSGQDSQITASERPQSAAAQIARIIASQSSQTATAQNSQISAAQIQPATAQTNSPENSGAENVVSAQEMQPAAVKRPDELRLVDLLKRSGIFSQADVQKSYEAMLKDPVRSGKFFHELGLLDEDDMKVAVRAHNLMTRGLLTQDEAIFALRGDRVTDFEKQITDVDNTKVKRYMDKQWRGRMSKVLGGAIVGALVAGLSMSKRK